MRTSQTQFETMVSFMELNGDLTKPTASAMGRTRALKKWEELRQLLNADPTGDPKLVDKWKKVWSDFKLNTKKKAAKINFTNNDTGNRGKGPILRLTPLEERVLSIIGVQAATGLTSIVEAGFQQVTEATQVTPSNTLVQSPSPAPHSFTVEILCNDTEWPMAGPSQAQDHVIANNDDITNDEITQTLHNVGNAISPGRSTAAEPAAQLLSPDVEPVAVNQPTQAVAPSPRRRLDTPRRRLATPRRRLITTPQAQGRATRGRRSPARRRLNQGVTDTAQLFLRSDAASREFERERWERDNEREAERNSLREREMAFQRERWERDYSLREMELAFQRERSESDKSLRERELAVADGWQKVAHQFLNMSAQYFNLSNNRY